MRRARVVRSDGGGCAMSFAAGGRAETRGLQTRGARRERRRPKRVSVGSCCANRGGNRCEGPLEGRLPWVGSCPPAAGAHLALSVLPPHLDPLLPNSPSLPSRPHDRMPVSYACKCGNVRLAAARQAAQYALADLSPTFVRRPRPPSLPAPPERSVRSDLRAPRSRLTGPLSRPHRCSTTWSSAVLRACSASSAAKPSTSLPTTARSRCC